jgi:tetratricopeptide (TPR) repeat protein
MEGPRTWGRLARKGAGTMRPLPGGEVRNQPMERKGPPDPDRERSEWRREDDGRSTTSGSPKRSGSRQGSSSGVSPEEVHIGPELAALLGPQRGPRAERKLREAARAFSRQYDDEAVRLLRPLAKEAPESASVRELLGLTLYRQGRWKSAIVELKAFTELTGSTEQHPVLADCHRAMGHHHEVARLWDELRAASPDAAVVTEGRIVMAGTLADRGRLEEAIALLGGSWQVPKRPREHHLRRAYALADLHERAGDVPRARDLFARVARAEPDFGDVQERLTNL